MSFVERMEACLGRIAHGFGEKSGQQRHPFQVVECKGVNARAVFSTLGLSSHPMWSEDLGKEVRFEIIIPSRSLDSSWIPNALSNLGSYFLKRNFPPLRGNFLDLSGVYEIADPYSGFYFTIPVFLEESCWLLLDQDMNDVILVWALPITTAEISVLSNEGWPHLEELLSQDPRLLIDFR
jgi:hypothetical protein